MRSIKRLLGLTSLCIMLTVTTVPTAFANVNAEADPAAASVLQPQNPVEEPSVPDSSAVHTITAFEDLETPEYYYEGDPTEEELIRFLPDVLYVCLDGSTEISEIPVSWSIVENYEETNYFFYSAKPQWPSNYKLSPSLMKDVDVPWITVYWEPGPQEKKQGEAEPEIPAEDPDDLEPVYTEEEGPVMPQGGSGQVSLIKILSGFTEESYAASSDTDRVFRYLTKNMGLNTAAACGVMTNLYAESGLRSNNLENYYNKKVIGLSDETYTSRVNAGKASNGKYTSGFNKTRYFTKDYCGYGIAQWTSLGRRQNLLKKAVSRKVSIDDLNMQLEFLKEELQYSYPHVWATLKGVPNNAAGAYLAAAEFCACFEIPANTHSTAVSRAKNAIRTYWKTYSGRNDSVTGSSFIGLCGYTYPQYVRPGTGMDVSGYVISNYSIKNVTARITDRTGKTLYSAAASPGAYFYSLGKMDAAMKFSRLSPGTYKYILAAKDSFGKTVTSTHEFVVRSSGSTVTLRGFSAGNVRTAAPAAASKPAAAKATPAKPAPAKPAAVTKPSAAPAAAKKPPAPSPSSLKITGCSYPRQLKKGQRFKVKGTVSSNVRLKKVTVGVYTASGKAKIKASRKVSSKSYKLKKLDKKLSFRKLPRGTFYYVIKVKDAKQTKVLLRRSFVVK